MHVYPCGLHTSGTATTEKSNCSCVAQKDWKATCSEPTQHFTELYPHAPRNREEMGQ